MKGKTFILKRRRILFGTTVSAIALAVARLCGPRDGAARAAQNERVDSRPQTATQLGVAREGGEGILPTLRKFGKRPGDDVSLDLVENPYLVITDGTYHVRSDITVFGILHFMGGSLTVDSGVTLKVNGHIIAPPQQIFFGSGTVEGRSRATAILPEWFGAKGEAYGPTGTDADDTLAVQRAFDFAGHGGLVLLTSMYAVRPGVLSLEKEHNEITVLGYSRSRALGSVEEFDNPSSKQPGKTVGFRGLGSGEFLLKTATDYALLEGFDLEGDRLTFQKGLLWARSLRKSKVVGVSFREVRGPFMFMEFGEDTTFDGCTFVLGGSTPATNKYGFNGGICFGRNGSSNTPNNVVFFTNHCRFERVDGGVFAIVRDPDDGKPGGIMHCRIMNCKFEQATNWKLWGQSIPEYPFIDLSLASDNAASLKNRSFGSRVETFTVQDCWINGTSRAKSFMDIRHADGVLITGNTFSFAKKTKLFNFIDGGPRGFVCETNNARVPHGKSIDVTNNFNADHDYRYVKPMFSEEKNDGKRLGRNLA